MKLLPIGGKQYHVCRRLRDGCRAFDRQPNISNLRAWRIVDAVAKKPDNRAFGLKFEAIPLCCRRQRDRGRVP